MRRVLLIGALFLSVAACAKDKDDTSTTDTLELRPAPAKLDTADTVKVDTTALKEETNGYDARYTTELRNVESYLRFARTLDPSSFSVSDQVVHELAQVIQRNGRQHWNDNETASRSTDLDSPDTGIPLLRSGSNWRYDSDRSECSGCPSTDHSGPRYGASQLRKAEGSANWSAESQRSLNYRRASSRSPFWLQRQDRSASTQRS